MTPNAQHKRAERERRKAAGYKRVEVWLDPLAQHNLASLTDKYGGKDEAVCAALWGTVWRKAGT